MKKTLIITLFLIAGAGCNEISKQQLNKQSSALQSKEIEVLKVEKPIVVVENDKKLEVEKLEYNKEYKMQDFLNSTIGMVSYSVLIFIAGGVLFAPAWSWVKSKLPFINK